MLSAQAVGFFGGPCSWFQSLNLIVSDSVPDIPACQGSYNNMFARKKVAGVFTFFSSDHKGPSAITNLLSGRGHSTALLESKT